MDTLSTAELATAAGYSVQQIRDLERVRAIPPATRAPNGYRRFTPAHLTAVRTYRQLAAAVGPVVARRTLREVRSLPLVEAAAAVSALHAGLLDERAEALAARRALSVISAEEPAGPDDPGDAMSITELAAALGVRTSTLRFWEREGLVHPDRVTRHAVRSYPPVAIADARITVALRSAGYRIPDVHAALRAVHHWGAVREPLATLQQRLDDIARRTVDLLGAGAHLAELISGPRDG